MKRWMEKVILIMVILNVKIMIESNSYESLHNNQLERNLTIETAEK